MFCHQCGKEVRKGALYCFSCGAKQKVVEEAPVVEAVVEEVAPVVEEPVVAVVEEVAPVVEEPVAAVVEEVMPVVEEPVAAEVVTPKVTVAEVETPEVTPVVEAVVEEVVPVAEEPVAAVVEEVTPVVEEPVVAEPEAVPVAAPVPEMPEEPQPVAPAAEAPTQAEPVPVAPAAEAPAQTAVPPVAPEAAPMQPVPTEGVPAQTAPKKKFPWIAVIIGAVVLIAIIVAVLILVLGGKKSGGYIKYGKDSFENIDIGYVKMDGTMYEYEEGDRYWEYYSSIRCNADHTVWSFIEDENRELFVITSKDMKPVSVAEDVVAYEISYTGDYLAYLVVDDMEASDPEVTLYLYNVARDNSIKIDDDAHPHYLVMSPTGNMVAYVSDYEGDTDNTLYIAGVKKEKEKIDKDGCLPIAISDNGKSFFYLDNSDSDSRKLYLYNGKESIKVDKNVDRTYYFNKNVTEVLYAKGDKTYFYNAKMEEPSKVAGDYLRAFYGGKEYDSYLGGYRISDYSAITSLDKLTGNIFFTDEDYYWLNNKGDDSVKICSRGREVCIAEDGQSILVVNRGGIYKFSNFSPEMDPQVIYEGDEEIEYIVASDDLSQIYAVNYDDELFYIKSKTKAEKISNDFAYDDEYIAYNELDKKIYYVEDDDLFSAGKNSKSKERILEDCDEIMSYGDGIVVFYDNNDEEGIVYFGKGKPVKIYTEEVKKTEAVPEYEE